MQNENNNEKSKKRPDIDARRKIIMHGGATGNKFAFAQELRRNLTETEKILWEDLSKKKLGGFRFRKQHPFNRFILDFYCIKMRLSVEIDGEIHNKKENKEYDAVRTKILKDNGISELRFTNAQILHEKDVVL